MAKQPNNDNIIVSGNRLTFAGVSYRCAIGRDGITGDKREGDHKTPIGTFPLRQCFYRPDRLPEPETTLPCTPLSPDDGWCDDVADALYNRHIKLPFAASHEELWREDERYDIIIPLGYNDDPVVAGKGSAIFLHVAAPDYTPTEGCVAVAPDNLLKLLQSLTMETCINIG